MHIEGYVSLIVICVIICALYLHVPSFYVSIVQCTLYAYRLLLLRYCPCAIASDQTIEKWCKRQKTTTYVKIDDCAVFCVGFYFQDFGCCSWNHVRIHCTMYIVHFMLRSHLHSYFPHVPRCIPRHADGSSRHRSMYKTHTMHNVYVYCMPMNSLKYYQCKRWWIPMSYDCVDELLSLPNTAHMWCGSLFLFFSDPSPITTDPAADGVVA